jgi:atypical dual specificity phosphatase
MNNLTHLPFNLAGEIYRCPMPLAKFDFDQSTLSELKDADVEKVIVLVPEYEWLKRTGLDLAVLYRNQGIKMIHFPVVDYSIPTDSAAYLKLVLQAKEWAESGENIAVHCLAGIGRTGTFLAALAMKVFGWGAMQAVLWVRQFIPGAVENEVQLAYVISLEKEINQQE